jgi:hypothetical protein
MKGNAFLISAAYTLSYTKPGRRTQALASRGKEVNVE